MKYLLICVVLFGCLHKGDHQMKEKGVVVGKQYQPNTKEVNVSYIIDSKGRMIPMYHTIGDEEKFSVVFKCEHNVIFAVNKAEVYAKVKEGDSVYIDYWELLNRKGKVKDYEFVDANKIK